jgi:hypothetical protein
MQLTEILKNVTLGEPLQWKNLQVFPLMRSNGHVLTYALIDDLVERNQAPLNVPVALLGDAPTVYPARRLTPMFGAFIKARSSIR